MSDLTTQEPTLRDQLAENLSAATESPTDAPLVVETPSKEGAEAQPAGDTRPRNADGTFAPKVEAAEKPATPAATPEPTAAPLAPETAVAAPKRPSTWKPELEAHWAKLPPEIHAEILRREADAARGVSTYKTEFDRVKPLDDAVAPYRQIMQQHGMNEAEAVKRLLDVQYALSMGQPQQKMDVLNTVISDYKLPVRLAVQNAEGQWTLLDAPQPRPTQTQQPPQDISAVVRAELQQQEVLRSVKEFQAAKGTDGNPLYPHYETVKDDMALLLERGKAEDLKSAYDKALRFHDDIWSQEQQKHAAAQAAEKARENAARVQRARSNAVSPASATTGAAMVNTGDKSLREQITENLREAAGGRV